MAGSTTNASKAFLLDYLSGRALAFPSTRATYLGLAFVLPIGEDPTLLNISEVNTAGYTRQAVSWGAPSANPVVIKSVADIQIGPLLADMTAAAQYAFLTDASVDTAGDILYVWNLIEPVQAKANKPIFVAAGALAIQ
jgi:hypothetical protein